MQIPQIVIPSKGRAGKSATIEKLIGENIVPIVIVEPQEFEIYREAYGESVRFVLLPESHRGIGYVRQEILFYARANYWEHYWMLDDDVHNFYRIENGKTVKVSAREALEGATKELLKIKNLAVGGMEYQQFAWSQKKPFSFNSYCEVVTFVNVKNTKLAKYRLDLKMKEDRDFVLQNLANGFVSARTSWWAFATPKNGTNKGGLYDEYKAGIEKELTEKFCSYWPGVCTPIVKKDGRRDAKINWRFFTNEPQLQSEAAPSPETTL